MLILPLHRPLTRATFPVVTALLILFNCIVYFGFQLADGAALQAAHEQYVGSGLGKHEVAAYERYLEAQDRGEELAELRALDEAARPDYVFRQTLGDVAFAARLQEGSLFAGAGDFEQWKTLRRRQDELRDGVFTLRHVMRSSEVDVWRMFASAFLHGDPGHLVGNMLFLAVLGLLVEGSLGPGRYLALYLLGGLGSSLAALAWRWGEAGSGLGASGAIAALMGALCVIWGRQPVRFFYWIGVVFDYVRAPAIYLLPVWLGWEVYNLLANGDLGIGFDAHAGGLVSGALLGGVAAATGQVRRAFIEDEPAAAEDDRWERAQAHLGKLQLAEADALLAELQREQPGRVDLALARYRVAKNGNNRVARADRVRELLSLGAADADTARLQAEVLAENDELRPVAAAGAELARRWTRLGELDAAERLLGGAEAGIEADAAAESALAQAWFELALRRRERQQDAQARRVLQRVAERYARQPQATKARFLLENG